MWRKRSGRRNASQPRGTRTWTAFITVDGYVHIPAARSERDDHDDQIMAAAHDAARLMRRTGADYGQIDLFRHADGIRDEFVEWRTVTFDQRGLVVSENQMTEPYRDPISPPDSPRSKL
jgi:hypothetical protein